MMNGILMEITFILLLMGVVWLILEVAWDALIEKDGEDE
jgi:hypothetical protein